MEDELVIIAPSLSAMKYHRAVPTSDGEYRAACQRNIGTAVSGADLLSLDHAENTGHLPCTRCWTP